MVTVKSRAHRILEALSGYSSWESTNSNLELIRGISLRGQENIIGFYRNDLKSKAPLLVITDLGIHIRRESTWGIIDYNNIAELLMPSSKKDFYNLTVKDNRGRLIELPVVGGRGKCYDAFGMLHFLMRVTEDLQRQR